MKSAVINLLRLGDLLQSAPLLYNLKLQSGGSVTLVAAREEALLLKRLGIVDEVIIFNPAKLSTATDLLQQFDIASKYLEQLPRSEFDQVIILNSLLAAHSLAKFIVKSEQHILGLVYDELRLQPDRICSYLYNLAPTRSLSLINLSELYLDYLPQFPEQFYRQMRKEPNLAKPMKPLIVINTSTGEAVRNFSAEFFAAVIDLLATEYSVQVVGTDSNISAQIQDLTSSDYIDQINRTSLDELTTLLKRADLFISADTGSIHLAALTGTKILGLYNISAYHHLTGAYSPYSWYLTPRINCYPCEEHYQPCGNLQCRNFYTPQAISSAVGAIVHNREPQMLENLDFSRTIINSDGCFIETISGQSLSDEQKNLRIAEKMLLFDRPLQDKIVPISLWWEQFALIAGKSRGELNRDLFRFLSDNPQYEFLNSLKSKK